MQKANHFIISFVFYKPYITVKTGPYYDLEKNEVKLFYWHFYNVIIMFTVVQKFTPFN